MTMRLSPHHIALLSAVLRYRLMTTEQVSRLVPAPRSEGASNVRSVANTLKRLHLDGFLGRDYVDPKKHQRETPARPSAIWFLEKKHFGKLCEHLAESSRADLAEDFATAHVFRDGATLAANTLRHELAITDFYMALDQAAAKAGTTAPLWLRTSPKHPDVSRSVSFTKTDKKTQKKTAVRLPLNPDGLHVLHVPGDRQPYRFFFLEMDMNTETAAEKLTNKFLAYYAYFQSKGFGPDIAAPFARKHRLSVPQPETAPFRVLFVAPTAKRRNDLLLKSRVLPTSTLFHFATMEDALAYPFGAAWLSKESFKNYQVEYDARTHTDNPALLRTWAHEVLNGLPRHAL